MVWSIAFIKQLQVAAIKKKKVAAVFYEFTGTITHGVFLPIRTRLVSKLLYIFNIWGFCFWWFPFLGAIDLRLLSIFFFATSLTFVKHTVDEID